MKNLVVQDPRTILLKLAEVSAKTSVLPKVRIELACGSNHQGELLGLYEHNFGFFVLLGAESRSHSEDSAISYLDVRSPYQLTVLNANQFAQDLRFGKVSRWSTDEAVGSLPLKRTLGELQTTLGKSDIQFGYSPELLSLEGLESNMVRDVMQTLQTFVTDTTKDEIGKESLKSVKTIRLESTSGSSFQVNKSGTELIIMINFKAGLPEKAAFIKKIEGEL